MTAPDLSLRGRHARADPLLGQGLALFAALSYGGITTLARLSYDGGGSPASLILIRFVFAAAVLALIAWRVVGTLDLPAGCRRGAILTGIVWLLGTSGYMGSVHFIPVGLAALLFFTFPLWVALFARLVEQAPLSLAGTLAFPLAFAGLALALGPSWATLDPVGIALALFGGLCAAGTFLLSRRPLERAPVLVFAAWTNSVALLTMVPLLLLHGALPGEPVASLALTWPDSTLAWLAKGGATLAYLVAVLATFGAIRSAGAARTALLMNLEPLISLALAGLLLGELLSPLQWLGALLVIAAVVLGSRARRPAARPQP